MKLFNWLSIAVASLLFICTGCPSPAPQKQKVQYASAKSPPDHSNAASPGQPDKVLKPIKISFSWTQPGSLKDITGWKFYTGPSDGNYTNSTLVATTNAIAMVYPGRIYSFFVAAVSTFKDQNGLSILVPGDASCHLTYMVPPKQTGPK